MYFRWGNDLGAFEIVPWDEDGEDMVSSTPIGTSFAAMVEAMLAGSMFGRHIPAAHSDAQTDSAVEGRLLPHRGAKQGLNSGHNTKLLGESRFAYQGLQLSLFLSW